MTRVLDDSRKRLAVTQPPCPAIEGDSFTAPAFAGVLTAKDKTDCEKAGGVWIDKTQKCGAKKQ